MTRPIGGFITATNRAPNSSSAMGTWSLDQALQYKKAELWPSPPPPQRIAYTWGYNNSGQLGTNNTTGATSPVSVVGGFTDWNYVASGGQMNMGIRTNGTAWTWGCNGQGRLGDNTATNRLSPVSVVGGFTDWCQLSGAEGNYDGSIVGFTMGIRSNGTAWGWGSNGKAGSGIGVIGTGTAGGTFASPVSVIGGFTDWCQVSAGWWFTQLVRQNGTIWGSGSNGVGQLGAGTTSAVLSPVSVVGGFTDWCQVSAATCNTLAVRQNGTAWGWGANNNGQLGDGTVTTPRVSPVSVIGGFTDWCQVAGGGCCQSSFSLGLRQNGTLWAWGANDCGQLGTNNTTARSSPVSVVGGFTDWCQITSSKNRAQGQGWGIRTNGTAWAWGSNGPFVRLGDGTTTNRSSPVSVVGGFSCWLQISGGSDSAIGMVCP